jgi:hypothetical protein
MGYKCRHEGDGFLSETESHYGTYDIWVCGDCGHEVPIDKLSLSHPARTNPTA